MMRGNARAVMASCQVPPALLRDAPCVLAIAADLSAALWAVRRWLGALEGCGDEQSSPDFRPSGSTVVRVPCATGALVAVEVRHAHTAHGHMLVRALGHATSAVAADALVRVIGEAARQSRANVPDERRVIVVHGACALSHRHQAALRKVVEQTHATALLILTATSVSALDAPLRSRAIVVHGPGPGPAADAPPPPPRWPHIDAAANRLVACVGAWRRAAAAHSQRRRPPAVPFKHSVHGVCAAVLAAAFHHAAGPAGAADGEAEDASVARRMHAAFRALANAWLQAWEGPQGEGADGIVAAGVQALADGDVWVARTLALRLATLATERGAVTELRAAIEPALSEALLRLRDACG